jgi:hypothetical protein
MLPFFAWQNCSPAWSNDRDYKERKLRFLKWMRDELENRLAGVNASIQSLEHQISQTETGSSSSTPVS